MRLNRQIQEQTSSGVNMTPMLDVVFILLIFFIVTATFVKEVGLPVNPPEDANTQTASNEAIVVEISQRDRLRVAGADVDVRLLSAQLARLHAERPEAPVVIRAHEDSSTERFVRVMDDARLVGIANVQLAR